MTVYAQPSTTAEITAYNFPTGLVGVIGVRVEDGQGNVITARTTSGIVESPVGSGIYTATVTAPSIGGSYPVILDDASGLPGGFAVETLFVGSSGPAALPSGVTLADLREHIETDLPDNALTRLLNDVTAEVEERFGTDAEITVDLRGGGETVRLFRPTSNPSTMTVVERDKLDDTGGALVVDEDYKVIHGGRTLWRLNGHRRWKKFVIVTYIPKSETELRDRVTVDLVKLAVTYNGFLAKEDVGDYRSATFGDYNLERERLLVAFANRRSGVRFI